MPSRRSDSDAPPSPSDRRSVPLMVTGGLMLLTVLVLANPWFGTTVRSWPWEAWTGADVPLRQKAVLDLWIVAALWSLLLSFAGPLRLRALGGVALAGLLLIETRRGGDPVALSSVSLVVLLPLIGLGSGLWLVRTSDTRALGRLLCGIGAVLSIWTMASALDGDTTRLGAYFRDVEHLFRDWRGDFAPPGHLWSSVLPRTLVLLASAFGLLVALGLSLRRTTTVFFYLLLAALLLPGFVEAFSRQDGSTVDEGPVSRLVAYVIAHGCLLWLLGVYALADLGQWRARRSAAAQTAEVSA